MTDFQNALARFLQRELDLPGLESELLEALQADHGDASKILQILDDLFRSSRLRAQDYIALKKIIAEAPAATPPSQVPVPPPPPAPSATELPSELQGESSDILDILQSGTEEPPPLIAEPPPSDVEGPPPSDDRTVFRQSAPPRRPHTKSSTPQTGTGAGHQTGTGAGYQTGPSGGISGRSGGPSIPTGTGSSWTDPSKWGEGPAPIMQPGSLLKDRYVLETIIGRGGMGVVFKARDLRREEAQDRNPHIAVKILNDEFRRHPESLKALQRESRKAQDLAHPNIVTVFDFDRDGQTVYMTMEFLEGQSLDRLVKDATFGGMSFKEAYPLIEGLGRALGYAHRKGVVHSDFKPANTFLTKEGVIKVFDFGIARAAKLPGQQSGEITLFDPGSLGALTPAYASCEMIDGEEPDPRDDIYALACLAYELLAGRHPFDKRPATDARDRGLKLRPIKGLSRRTWHGLQRGLAFRREDRTPDIETFLRDIKTRKLNKTTVGLAAAASLAAIAVSVILVPGYIEDRRIEGMISSIVEGDVSRLDAIIEELKQLDVDVREAVISDGQVEDQLIAYYVSRVLTEQDAMRYPEAAAILEEARTWYDDSNRLARTGEDLDTGKADKLQELDDRYNAHLRSRNILPSDEDDITDVLEEYRLVDPGNAALTDPRLAIAYADLAERLLASDVLQAARVVDEGQQRFPDDVRLIGVRDRVETLLDVQDRALRVAELERQLSEGVTDIVELGGFRALDTAIIQLDTLDPENRVLAETKARLERLLDERIDEALADNDWASARIVLSEYSALARSDYAAAALQRIDEQASEYDDRVGGAYARVTDAVQSGDLDQAASNLIELEQLNAAPATIRQARQIVTRGYLGAAQSERGAGRYSAARELIEAGRVVDPAFPGWQAELKQISQDERLASEALAEREKQKLQLERQARIDELKNAIRADLEKTPFGIVDARGTVASIDELARLDPSEELARNGRRELADKLASQARGLGIRDQNFDEAVALLAQSIELLPAEQSLRREQAALQAELQADQRRLAAEQEQEFRDELERLIGSPNYDSAWDGDLRRVFQGLDSLARDSGYGSDKRLEVAALYVARAEELRGEERYDLAEQMLSSSEWYVADYAPAQQERQVLAQARREFDAANRERQSRARIDGLKRSFTTELNAERVDDARTTLAGLRKSLPGNDPFLVSEAPRAIADTYSRMATRALDEGRFDRAEQLARLGLKEVSNHRGLTTLVEAIGPMRLQANLDALKQAISSGDPTDSARPKALMDKIRQDAGSRLPAIEAELKGLADRRVSAAKNDPGIVQWMSRILAGYEPPPLAGPACTPEKAGYGRRGAGRCYDYLPGSAEAGPRLVVIPAGGGVSQPYAIARQEVSIGEWNAYCRLSGNCTARSAQSEQLPITNISVREVEAYASWLTVGTKHKYRLPTDREWTHAATATGSAPASKNCFNPAAGLGTDLLEVNWGTQNAWGIKNFIGNAQEWVVDPSGGYNARGGAYSDRLGNCAIGLSKPHAGSADKLTGFRLVRELGEDV